MDVHIWIACSWTEVRVSFLFNVIHFSQCQIKNCDSCSKLLDTDGKIKLPDPKDSEVDENTDAAVLKRQVGLTSV